MFIGLCGATGGARRDDAILFIDEPHAVGVEADRGQGLTASLGLSRVDHVVVTVTLSKSLAAQNGAVLGHTAVREQLVNPALLFIYDTGLAPASAGAALAATASLTDDRDLASGVRPTLPSSPRAVASSRPPELFSRS